MSVINTNVLSLITQNNLSKSQGALQTAISRLSSGLRINSAKDDAAGEAIANRFTATIRGLTQAQRNANDGISLAQTTEGALDQVNDNLQRIRELTVQAQNGSNSSADKASIQAEIAQRLAEIDRNSSQTDFNGVKVLSATQTLGFQVGASDGQTISIGLKKIDSTSLGMAGFSVASNSLKVGAAITQTNLTGTPVAVDLSTVATNLGVSASTLSLHNLQDPTTGAASNQFVVQSGSDYYAVSVNDTTGAVSLNQATYTFTDPANSITAPVTVTNAYVKVGVDASTGTATNAAYVTLEGKNYELPGAAGNLVNGGAAGTSTAAGANGNIVLSGASATAQFAGAASANPLATIDAALKQVDDYRSALGAVQNRFDSVISNLGTTVTNLTASRSRIQDADYATEVSNMSRAQILQQAGTSVLAQANQSTQGVLSLLR